MSGRSPPERRRDNCSSREGLRRLNATQGDERRVAGFFMQRPMITRHCATGHFSLEAWRSEQVATADSGTLGDAISRNNGSLNGCLLKCHSHSSTATEVCPCCSRAMDKITDKIAALPPDSNYFSLEFFPPKTQQVCLQFNQHTWSTQDGRSKTDDMTHPGLRKPPRPSFAHGALAAPALRQCDLGCRRQHIKQELSTRRIDATAAGTDDMSAPHVHQHVAEAHRRGVGASQGAGYPQHPGVAR